MVNLLLFVHLFYIVYFLQQQINNNIPNIIIYLHINNTVSSLSLCELGATCYVLYHANKFRACTQTEIYSHDNGQIQ